jgi:hypothetical protein
LQFLRLFPTPGPFDTSIWGETVLGSGNVIDTRETSGGNPDAFLELQTIPNGGVIAQGAYINSAATWVPGTQGAISSISMSVDMILFQQVPGYTDGQAYGIALEQDGTIFRSGYSITGLQYSEFDPRTILDVAASGFHEIIPSTGGDGTAIPDFSASGGLISLA